MDISYVWPREGWLYLAMVINLFSRRVVGWSISDRLHRSSPWRLCAEPWRSDGLRQA